MNATEVQAGYRPDQETTSRTIVGGAMIESIGALATIALAVVGLAGVLSMTMAAIATIVLGAAILIEGGAFAARSSEAASTIGSLRQAVGREGVSAGFLGGLTGIILAVLAILGTSPATLLSVAMLVYGVTFLLGGTTGSTANGQSLIGFGAIVLGVLAIVGLNPLTLVLAALASLGASALLTGSATCANLAPAVHK
jgi:hypothetical protein